MRLVFRFFGLVALAAAFAALLVDGTASVAADRIMIHPLGEALAVLAPQALAHARDFVTSHDARAWDDGVARLLLLPSWLVLGALGFLLLVATRPSRLGIGHRRR